MQIGIFGSPDAPMPATRHHHRIRRGTRGCSSMRTTRQRHRPHAAGRRALFPGAPPRRIPFLLFAPRLLTHGAGRPVRNDRRADISPLRRDSGSSVYSPPIRVRQQGRFSPCRSGCYEIFSNSYQGNWEAWSDLSEVSEQKDCW